MKQWFERFKAYMSFRFQLTASNPKNFEKFWSLALTRSQFFSALLAFLILGGFLVSVLFGGLFSGENFDGLTDDERQEMRVLRASVETMAEKTKQQENYVNRLRDVLKGTVSADSLKELSDTKIIDPKTIDTLRSKSELLLAQKVAKSLGSSTSYRIPSPLDGVEISETYHSNKHPYLTLTATKDAPFFAFAEGITLLGKQHAANQLVMSFEGGIVVAVRNLSSVQLSSGDKITVGKIVGRVKRNTQLEVEIRKGDKPINPTEVFDFQLNEEE